MVKSVCLDCECFVLPRYTKYPREARLLFFLKLLRKKQTNKINRKSSASLQDIHCTLYFLILYCDL